MKRARLPLTALRSFEAAARHQSFTRGADELLISQAAISRQVRMLEQGLGMALFERRHRAVALTQAGCELLTVVTAAFDSMSDTLDRLRGVQAASTVTVSVEPSFASGWLVAHLPSFAEEEPDVDVVVDAQTRLVDFRGDGIDLAIRHSSSATSWQGAESRLLGPVRAIAVAAPKFLSEGRPLLAPADLLGRPLLHEENRNVWRQWFEEAGLEGGANARGPVFADGGLVLQAALRGQGIALVDAAFAAQDLAEGRLERLFDVSLRQGSYFLVARRFTDLPPPAAAFARWLLGRVDAQKT